MPPRRRGAAVTATLRCGSCGAPLRALVALAAALALLSAPVRGQEDLLWHGHDADAADAADADDSDDSPTFASELPPAASFVDEGHYEPLRWRAATVPRDPGRDKTVALCFFGLTRSLSFTIRSIAPYLITPLQKAGFTVHIFLHTYDLAYIHSSWSSEKGYLNTTEWRLLEPLGLVEAEVTSQSKFMHDSREDFEACESHGTPHGWPDDGDPRSILHHHLCQLNSIKHVSALWQKWHETENYTAVVYARPDVWFNCHLPGKQVAGVEPNTLYTPDVNKFGGLNDRFAFAAPDVARIYGNRLDYTYTQCRKERSRQNAPHAEKFLGKMVKELNITAVDIVNFHFYRVRSNGLVAVGDLATQVPCKWSKISHLRVELRQVVRAAQLLHLGEHHSKTPEIIPGDDETEDLA